MIAAAKFIRRTILVILLALWNGLTGIIMVQNYQQTSILVGIMNLLCPPDQLMTGMDAALVILSGPHETEVGIMIIGSALQCVGLPVVVTDLHITGRNPPMAGRSPHI